MKVNGLKVDFKECDSKTCNGSNETDTQATKPNYSVHVIQKETQYVLLKYSNTFSLEDLMVFVKMKTHSICNIRNRNNLAAQDVKRGLREKL